MNVIDESVPDFIMHILNSVLFYTSTTHLNISQWPFQDDFLSEIIHRKFDNRNSLIKLSSDIKRWRWKNTIKYLPTSKKVNNFSRNRISKTLSTTEYAYFIIHPIIIIIVLNKFKKYIYLYIARANSKIVFFFWLHFQSGDNNRNGKVPKLTKIMGLCRESHCPVKELFTNKHNLVHKHIKFPP